MNRDESFRKAMFHNNTGSLLGNFVRYYNDKHLRAIGAFTDNIKVSIGNHTMASTIRD
jgi:hypothetical protein